MRMVKSDSRGRRMILKPGGRRGFLLLLLLLLPLLLGGWRDVSGNTINPRYVERIKDGQTTKQEILLLFGEPQEIARSPEGVVFTFKSFKDAPATDKPYRHEERKIAEQSDQPYILDQDRKVRKAPLKTEGKILRSTLVIRFKPDGLTVMSHEYKEF